MTLTHLIILSINLIIILNYLIYIWSILNMFLNKNINWIIKIFDWNINIDFYKK